MHNIDQDLKKNPLQFQKHYADISYRIQDICNIYFEIQTGIINCSKYTWDIGRNQWLPAELRIVFFKRFMHRKNQYRKS